MVMAAQNSDPGNSVSDYVTVTIGEHLFGLPIARVQDVFVPDRLTRVPLAPPEVAGILNLRGRVLTAIDMHPRLALGTRPAGCKVMAVGIEFKGESYGLLVDEVGEVISLADGERLAKPANLDARLGRMATGVYRLKDELLIVLDIDSVLDIRADAVAALRRGRRTRVQVQGE
jgi:purine-binding chemotaxis protein CheW